MARPRCPQHPESSVVFDGTYGPPGRKRQRVKCQPGNGERRHVFTHGPPRLVAAHAGSECLDCERVTPRHEGPQLARRFEFTTQEVASALVEVGRGTTYRAAAEMARLRGENPFLVRGVSRQPNLVADWVELFAPVLFRPHILREWSEVIVIDELPFSEKTGRKKGKPIFTILAAVGYYNGQPRLIKLEAFPSASKRAWQHFLFSTPGVPRRVVCDESRAIVAALADTWPAAQRPRITFCHFHLAEQLEALVPARFGPDTTLGAALKNAFLSERTWQHFVQTARASGLSKLQHWLDRKEQLVARQIAERSHPKSTGALEQKLREIKKMLSDRRSRFRNRERLNRLLMLIQLELTGQRNVARYAREIRASLTTREGWAGERHRILDPGGLHGVSSLRL